MVSGRVADFVLLVLTAVDVWGGNEVARGLYRSLGWDEQSVHMRKRL